MVEPTASPADDRLDGVPAPLRKYARRLQRSLPAAVGKRFIDIDVLTQAASVSFYALLSMAPLLVLLLWLTASLYPPAQQALIGQIGDVAGASAASVAQTVLSNANTQPDIGSLAGVWSTLLLFIGATAVFAQLQNALNRIFHTDAQRLDGLAAWLRKRVFSFGVVLALGFVLLLSMTATTALQVAFARLPSVLPAIGYLTTLLLYAVAFAFLYHYLPDRRVAWRQAFIGGAITSALFALGRYAIGLYIATVAPGSAYGSMGALVILLVWIYYATVTFFVGALMTAVIDERQRARLQLARAGLAPDSAPAGTL
ncbi:YihY/virulence factor BrkB family protein [Stenotrophomonas rhizophila]|uniref:YihY/virulence factor BrkB family protein n=1 Tax=Stenotrophomonas rhizophila TaxID=216778 RepID=UPI001E4A7446|nr:YihY/virulence factor BrkB family protein [Stenotrophomonas rhizophila]MCC7635725.1 YihY/virulence factor BrkB family protein [Stenotrophomonas rhizophila]MCC7665012.1 YihY/virulence factor BrkB family protein [Stenotrophomonas rhizophila]